MDDKDDTGICLNHRMNWTTWTATDYWMLLLTEMTQQLDLCYYLCLKEPLSFLLFE